MNDAEIQQYEAEEAQNEDMGPQNLQVGMVLIGEQLSGSAQSAGWA